MMYRTYISQAEYDRIVAEGAAYEAEGRAPHCNENVVHYPGVCAFCDGQPNWQAKHGAEVGWTHGEANGWGGNKAPTVNDALAAEEEQAWVEELARYGR